MQFKSQTKIEALSGNALFLIDLFTSPADTPIIDPADSMSNTDDSGACTLRRLDVSGSGEKALRRQVGNAMKEISEPVRGDLGILVSAFCSPGVRLRVGLKPSELL